jgi:hypothetical protein
MDVTNSRLARHHNTARTLFDVSSSAIKKSTEAAVQEFRKEITADLHLVRRVYSVLLRIPTAVMETQTDPLPLVDMDTMTLNPR